MLRALSDNFQKHLRVLQQLREPVDKWDTLIIYLVTSKLDPTTKKEWELKVVQEKTSTIRQLIEFLDTRCQFLETLHPTRKKVIQAKVSIQKSNQINAKNQVQIIQRLRMLQPVKQSNVLSVGRRIEYMRAKFFWHYR